MTPNLFKNLLRFTAAAVLGGCATGGGVSSSSMARPPLPSAAHAATLPRSAGRLQKTLFVADVNSSVLLYSANIHAQNPPLLGQITQGVTRSTGVAVDQRTGTLYAMSSGGSQASIAEYKRSAMSPFKTITSGLFAPGTIVVDAAGTIYVTDSSGSAQVVLVYAPKAQAPTRTITIPQNDGGLGGLAFAANRDLLVATFDTEHRTGTVYSVAPGSSKPVNLNLQEMPGGSLGADKAGNIYAGNPGGEIAVYTPGSQTPSRFISANVDGFYSQMMVMPNGTIYWPNYDNEQMYEFAPGAPGPTNVFKIAGSGVAAAVGSW